MSWMRSCRDVTRLVLEAEDRQLSLRERIGVRLHLLICATCPPFRSQVRLMRQAMQRWRSDREGDGTG